MNPGCSEDISLGELVTLIEELTGKKAQCQYGGIVLYNLTETSVPSLRLVSTSSRPLCFESSLSKGFKSSLFIEGI